MADYDWNLGPHVPWKEVHVLRDRLSWMKIGDFMIKDLPLIIKIMGPNRDGHYPTQDDVDRLNTAIWEISLRDL